MARCIAPKTVCIGLIIFFAGAVTLGGIKGFFAYTNQTEFCISCHSMSTNYEEYKESLHYKNIAGVRAACSDCHVPEEFAELFKVKLVAARDVYHEIIGTIDTEEKFEQRRWILANRVWERMRASNSRECKTCHDYDSMDLEEQDKQARRKHARVAEGEKDKTCIDCHRGIVHEEPLEPDEATEVARHTR